MFVDDNSLIIYS
ncbi:Core protein A15, partial [Monkeypox virus]